jgi:hypothetical protein
VIARLERDVRGRAAWIVAARLGVAQCLDLGMRLTAAMVPSLAERDAVANQDAADRRIWGRVGDSARGELARAREVRRVAVYGWTSTPFQNAT